MGPGPVAPSCLVGVGVGRAAGGLCEKGMSEKLLMRSGHALAEAALRAGCKFYFAYPMTPATEILEYWTQHAAAHGASTFVAESEVESGNYLMGCASTGTRCMAGSTGTGLTLMSEAVSRLAAAEFPVVLINFPRAGPGTGIRSLGQNDYFLATKATGNGDFHCITLAPWSAQEVADLTTAAFHLAERFRNPVLILGDDPLAQMMESVEFKRMEFESPPPKDWVVTGERNKDPSRRMRSMEGDEEGPEAVGVGSAGGILSRALAQESMIRRLYAKYAAVPPLAQTYQTEDAELVVVSFGSVARLISAAMERARAEGLRVGLFRPQTLYPFPGERLRRVVQGKRVLVVEANTGMMVQDVALALRKEPTPLYWFGRTGGVVPTVSELVDEMRAALAGQRQEIAW